jgi:hypothetical protein
MPRQSARVMTGVGLKLGREAGYRPPASLKALIKAHY